MATETVVSSEDIRRPISIAEYDTIHINGYTIYFEPYDSTREYIEPKSILDTNNYRVSRNRREAVQLEKCTHCFTRVNDTLTLTFRKGTTSSYIDNDEEDDEHFAHYEFGGAENGYYFVDGYFWEWTHVKMIDITTGYAITLLRSPYFTPDNKSFATIVSDLEAQYQPNGLTYYNIVSHDSIEQQFSLEIENWGPSAMNWLNDTTAIVEKESLSGQNDPPYTYSYTKMTITKP